MMFGSVRFRAFHKFSEWQTMQNLYFSTECTILGTGLSETVWLQTHPFSSSRPKMMSVSVSDHFANCWQNKRCKTCVLSLNALFLHNELSQMISLWTHQLYSISPNMMFGSVSEHSTTLQQKKIQNLCFETKCTILGTKLLEWFPHVMRASSTIPIGGRNI
jgi:hypothetical protein